MEPATNGAPDEFTRLLDLASRDDASAKERLFQLVYDQLRAIASRLLKGQFAGDLQTTALVHEAFIKFERGNHLRNFANRKVFFSVAIRAMQQVLIDHQRHRLRALDGPKQTVQSLDYLVDSIEERAQCKFDVLMKSLRRLEQESPRLHAVVTYRFFGGLSYSRLAELLDVSVGTAERDWRLARAYLLRMIEAHDKLDFD
ncbi:MAG: sigma-70 family RNA polymerase sigma factor [Planctomycetales bacterium]|nr:sigma-70 family RNA polymerase sigma factor [Planctomycetales bacterium]